MVLWIMSSSSTLYVYLASKYGKNVTMRRPLALLCFENEILILLAVVMVGGVELSYRGGAYREPLGV